jgi:selenide,water dikinase
MGFIHPDQVLTKAGAQPGDVLILTKPLGVGIITTALKGEVAEPEHVAAAVTSMKRLNRDAAQVARETGVHACTDVTGFGILGHGHEMALKSGVRLRLYVERLPFLDGALRYANEWLFPGGTHNNKGFYKQFVSWPERIEEEMQLLLYTPETSGGLLIAVPAEHLDAFVAGCNAMEQPFWVIGDVVEGEGIKVRM